MTGPKLWWMVPAMATQNRVDGMQGATPPKAEVVNLGAIYDVLFGPPGSKREPVAEGVHLPVSARDLSAMPTPRFRIAPPKFAFDFFILGLPTVSDRLARTLALPPDAVRYIDVDCSECPPRVREMGYKVLNITTYANPLDRQRTGPGHFVDLTTPDGDTFVWVTEPSHRSATAPVIAWRDDFVAPAPLFNVPGSAWMLATEELAARVADAGFKDVAFLDVTNDGTRKGELVFRNA